MGHWERTDAMGGWHIRWTEDDEPKREDRKEYAMPSEHAPLISVQMPRRVGNHIE